MLYYIFLEKEIEKKKFFYVGGSWLFFVSPGQWIGNKQLFKVGLSKNNDDLQFLFITLFFPLSDVLGNHHIKFSHFCFYTTKILSPVLLAFQFPIKNRMCCVQETIYSKNNHNRNFFYSCVVL